MHFVPDVFEQRRQRRHDGSGGTCRAVPGSGPFPGNSTGDVDHFPGVCHQGDDLKRRARQKRFLQPRMKTM